MVHHRRWPKARGVSPDIFGALKLSLAMSVEALDYAPLPGLKAAGSLLLTLVNAIEVSVFYNFTR